jgi:hypothetical protein
MTMSFSICCPCEHRSWISKFSAYYRSTYRSRIFTVNCIFMYKFFLVKDFTFGKFSLVVPVYCAME